MINNSKNYYYYYKSDCASKVRSKTIYILDCQMYIFIFKGLPSAPGQPRVPPLTDVVFDLQLV